MLVWCSFSFQSDSIVNVRPNKIDEFPDRCKKSRISSQEYLVYEVKMELLENKADDAVFQFPTVQLKIFLKIFYTWDLLYSRKPTPLWALREFSSFHLSQGRFEISSNVYLPVFYRNRENKYIDPGIRMCQIFICLVVQKYLIGINKKVTRWPFQ